MIEIFGQGGLALHPKHVSGGGDFSATALELGGAGPVAGTWKAVQLLSFKSYGPSPDFPDNFHSGLAMIRIHLMDEGGNWVADAVLRLGCRLPDANFPPSTIEGVRVNVQGGLNFNLEVDPTSTLFIEL